jgi:hypothetical protein
MSLGPTNNASSANQTRLTQTLRTQMEQTERLDRSKPADAQALPSEQMDAQRVTASPEAQAESRAGAKGTEDAIKARLQQTQDAPTSTDAPKRGLGNGGSDLDGQLFVNKRSGKGRRTAMNEGSETPSAKMANRSGDTPATDTVGESPILMAGKRTGRGTRVGTADTPPMPGSIPTTDIA